MLKLITRLMFTIMGLGLTATAVVYAMLRLSLPTLDGQGVSHSISQPVSIARDSLGQAVISAKNRNDAAYGLGYAHAQDRFFQMDLLRRNAAGELSEIFGKAALSLDKKMRFHQFRQRSKSILKRLSSEHKQLLAAYAQGVNEGLAQLTFPSFEYFLTGAPQQPWRSEDSLLVIFSMYLDLQSTTFERDRSLMQIEHLFGKKMRLFLTQPSQYQAALDGSTLPVYRDGVVDLPALTTTELVNISDVPLRGSNNWAVTGAHTATGNAMVSDDMHLSLAVPVIWYRAQLNYLQQQNQVQVTGVSLPGAPAIVVGSNNKVAWGFTNGYIDTADWIALTPESKTWSETEKILVANEPAYQHSILLSEYGPVKYINNKPYALSWVAHQPYAVNMQLTALEQASSVDEALNIASDVGVPVQNLMVVDQQGNAAWKHIGAIPARKNPSEVGVSAADYSRLWLQNETIRPQRINPAQGRLWTANSRVVSATEHLRFGNGGYALGARATQIRDRLFEQQHFSEADFYQLQHDNQARFLTPWHSLLLQQLNKQPEQYSHFITQLENWQRCACATSIGYTLVKYYRNAVINTVFASLEQQLNTADGSLSSIKRDIEPALWQLIEQQPSSWVNPQYQNWDQQLVGAFDAAVAQLTQQYGKDIQQWQWGKVNATTIQHPFAQQIPILAQFLNMPSAAGFGDSFMPAVQTPNFGASQRFIAQPGHLQHAIMTLPGGQSGHPLSAYYRAGFSDYIAGELTPLLPQQIEHEINITAQ